MENDQRPFQWAGGECHPSIADAITTKRGERPRYSAGGIRSASSSHMLRLWRWVADQRFHLSVIAACCLAIHLSCCKFADSIEEEKRDELVLLISGF
jgi:hypothetical protein